MYQRNPDSNPYEEWERLRSNKPANVPYCNGRNLVFIVGAPRSGTTWLQRLLASHPRIHTGQESYLFSNYIGPQIRKWKFQRNPTRTRRVGLGCYLNEEEFYQYIQFVTYELLDKITGNMGEDDIFLEKTPAHALWVTEIAELLPEAKFIHIIRDPRDVVCSLMAASKSSWANHWAPSGALDAIRIWKAHVEAAEQSLDLLSQKKVLRLRYENLHEATLNELSRVFDFLNVGYKEDFLSKIIEKNSAKESWNGHLTEIPIRGEESRTTGHSAVSEPKDFIRKARAGSWRQDLALSQRLLLRCYTLRMKFKGSLVWPIVDEYYNK